MLFHCYYCLTYLLLHHGEFIYLQSYLIIVLGMSKQEDFGRPVKLLEKTREIDNKARIAKKAEMKRKFKKNQNRITL